MMSVPDGAPESAGLSRALWNDAQPEVYHSLYCAFVRGLSDGSLKRCSPQARAYLRRTLKVHEWEGCRCLLPWPKGRDADNCRTGIRRETFCAYLGQDLFYLTAFAQAYSASLDKASQVRHGACNMAHSSFKLCAMRTLRRTVDAGSARVAGACTVSCDWLLVRSTIHTRCCSPAASQVDDEAVADIQALLQGVRDEIDSLHATFLKVRPQGRTKKHGVAASCRNA